MSLRVCVSVTGVDVGANGDDVEIGGKGPGEICDEGSGKDVADDTDEIEGTLVGEGAEVGDGTSVVGCGLG